MDVSTQEPHKLFYHPVRYRMPPLQRRYVWEKEKQWEPLWEDVETLADSILENGAESTDPHFMGALVFKQELNKTGALESRMVIDGQQRLTTLQLIIRAIKDVMESQQQSASAERLSNLVTNSELYRNGDPLNAFKVLPSRIDRSAFQAVMSDQTSASESAESLIVQAHGYFKSKAEQWLEQTDQLTERSLQDLAIALERAVSEFLQLVIIDLDDSDNPHVIFETLNARGTPLLQSDMIKNRIFQDLDIGISDEEEVSEEEKTNWPFGQDEWWTENVGSGFQQRPRIDLYLNHWLTLRNLSETKAYVEFNAFENYAKDKSIKDIAVDLGELGSIYKEVETSQRPDISKFLQRRKVMNVGVMTPLLLYLLSKEGLEPARLTNCLNAIESFLVRRMICGYHARNYGELFLGCIQALHDCPVSEFDRITVAYFDQQTAQSSLWPGDDELRDRFISEPIYQRLTKGRLRMVLEALEEKLRSREAETDEVPPRLPIEHIMPQTWQTYWSLPESEESIEEAIANRERIIHTIGNLTLVNRKLNSVLSNAAWAQKRRTLADHSVLFLNKKLVNNGPEVWDESKIEKRGKELCKEATEIWPHADDIVTVN